MSKLERIIHFRPAYDKRDPDPKKNYGIHGAELAFYLKGPAGTIQFVVYTNWQLPHVKEEMDQKTLSRPLDQIQLNCFYHPRAVDLGYHSPVPHYESQTRMTDSCEWTDGKSCYYDGSTLNAERVFELLLREGDEAVWKELERYYDGTW